MIRNSQRVAIAALMTLTLALGTRASHADIAWTRDMRAAQAEAQQTGKPIFIDFYTDWCGWCKKLDSDVYTNSTVQGLARKFVMVKLNAEAEGSAYAQHYQVSGFPTMIFLNSKTQYLTKIPGYVEAGDMTRMMKSVLAYTAQQSAATKTAPTKKAGAPSMPSLYRAPQTGRTSTTAKQRDKLPEISNLKTQPGYSGVYMLSEDGAVALDAPVVKKKPTTATAKKKTSK